VLKNLLHREFTTWYQWYLTASLFCFVSETITLVIGMISRLAGESPAMSYGRREHAGEGKGVRRSFRLLPDGGGAVND